MNECPSSDDLAALLNAETNDAQATVLETHISDCARCEKTLQELIAKANDDWEDWRAFALHASEESDAATLDADRHHKIDLMEKTLIDHGLERVELVGQGGMGIVFYAWQPSMKRAVAAKMVIQGVLSGPDRRQRLLNEAQAIGRLRHENILAIYEVSELDSMATLILEYAADGSLREKLVDGPLPQGHAVDIAIQIANGLSHAHQNSVLHRDVKPANILFDSNVVKLADFGLAKQGDSNSEDDLTGEQLIGTPVYMAPEQVRGEKELHATTDIYATGAVLYQMLCGTPPIRSSSKIDTLRQIIEKEPLSPRTLRPGLARDLETICLKCLQKEPKARYATAEDLANDLSRFKRGEPISARPAGPIKKATMWCRRNPAWATVGAAAIAIIFGLLGFWGYFTGQLAEQKGIAERNATEANKNLAAQLEANDATQEVLRFLTQGLFAAAMPENEGIDVRVVEILDNAEHALDQKYVDRPLVEAPLQLAIAETYYELGLPDRSKPHALRAVELYRAMGTEADASARFDAESVLAELLMNEGNLEEAEQRLEWLRNNWVTVENELSARFKTCEMMLKERQPDQASAALESLYEDCARELGTHAPLTLNTLGQLAVLEVHAGNNETALEMFEKQLEGHLANNGEEHPDPLISMNNIAIVLVRLGRIDEAEKWHARGHEIRQRVLGPSHKSTLGSKHNWAMSLWRLERHDEAIELLREAVYLKIEKLGIDHPKTLDSQYQFGRMCLDSKQFKLGSQHFKETIEPLRGVITPNGHWASLLIVYGRLQIGNGEIHEVGGLIDRVNELFAIPGIANESREQRFELLKQSMALALAESDESGSSE